MQPVIPRVIAWLKRVNALSNLSARELAGRSWDDARAVWKSFITGIRGQR